MTGGLARREFIVSLLALLWGLPLSALGVDRKGVRSDLFGNRTLDTAAIRKYTGLYLKKNPGEADIDTLIGLLFGKGYDGDREKAKAALQSGIRGDFRAARTVNLDGWILSVTELRFWCLYVLAFEA